MRQDPNSVCLRADTSRRLVSLLGSSFETDEFCTKLEGYIDGLSNRIGTLRHERNDLKRTLQEAEQRLEVLALQRLYLGIFCAVAIASVLLLLCK